MALPVLQQQGIPIPNRSQNDSHDAESNSHGTPRVDIVAIGPTTAEYLSNEENIHVATTASKPTPEGLAEVVDVILSRRDTTGIS